MIDILPVHSPDERTVLGNLFELYLYDFSTVEALPLGPDGRFSRPDMLQPYWDEPGRHPFLVRLDGAPAGFALVKRGSALAGDPQAMDLAEFFILRCHRRSGIGRQAAMLVWDRFPGRWLVRVLAANTPALAFWERVIALYTQGDFVREPVRQEDHTPPREWLIFRFERKAGP